MVAAKKEQDINAGPEMTFDERMAVATAPGWRPEPGTKIEKATVIRIRQGGEPEPAGYGYYPVVVYRTQEGEYIAIHAMHQILREELKRLGTQRGSVQNLAYLGRRKGNKPKANGDVTEYELYYVENWSETLDGGADEDFKF